MRDETRGAVFGHGSFGYGLMLSVGRSIGVRCCERHDAVYMAAVGLGMLDMTIDLRRGCGGESWPLVGAQAIQDSLRRPWKDDMD